MINLFTDVNGDLCVKKLTGVTLIVCAIVMGITTYIFGISTGHEVPSCCTYVMDVFFGSGLGSYGIGSWRDFSLAKIATNGGQNVNKNLWNNIKAILVKMKTKTHWKI